MNRKLYLFGMLAMVLLLASCKKEKETGSDPFNISAGIENDGSKTLLDGFKVKWILGDKIRIYDGTSQDGVVFTSKTLSNDDQTANFTCNASESIAESGSYWAIYPETGTYDRGAERFSFSMNDAQQAYYNDNTPTPTSTPMLFPMVATASKNAKGSGVFFYFQHAFGVLKIPAVGDATITSIQLEDNNGKYLSGNFTVDANAEHLLHVSGGSTIITLNASVTLKSTPTDFYFILPPGSLGRFSVRFYNGSTCLKEFNVENQSFVIQRSMVITANASLTQVFEVYGNSIEDLLNGDNYQPIP